MGQMTEMSQRKKTDAQDYWSKTALSHWTEF